MLLTKGVSLNQNKSMRYLLPALTLATALLTGCEAQQPDAPPVNAVAEFDGMSYARRSPTQSRDTIRARMDAQRAAFDAVEQGLAGIPLDDPQKADIALQRVISQLPEASRLVGQQIAAGVLIDVFLARTPDTPATQEIAARHTEQLVSVASPEAPLVLAGLRETGDRWDVETRRRIARQALVPADEWIASERVRQPTSPSARVRVTETLPGLARTEAAVVELRRLAETK